MWPFTTSESVERALIEQQVSRAEMDDVLRRLKLIEREHDDLHAAYRRLRAVKAQEASKPLPRGNGEPEELPDAISRKEQLRRQLLPGLHGKRGDGS